MNTDSTRKKIFGDFQTPLELTIEIFKLIQQFKFEPKSIIEPQCGLGSFVISAKEYFPESEIFAMDINLTYINTLDKIIKEKQLKNIHTEQIDFFQRDWKQFFSNPHLKNPSLIVGNPPWVTTSDISLLTKEENKTTKITQKPIKKNIYGIDGINAITGNGNFDISESIIILLLEALVANEKENITLVMICKVTVARNIFRFLAKKNLSKISTKIFILDSKKYFNVTVDACVLVCSLEIPSTMNNICPVYDSLKYSDLSKSIQTIGLTSSNELIADIVTFDKWKHLLNQDSLTVLEWRSGIKHDSSKIMELIKIGKENEDQYKNGLMDTVTLEEKYLFPLLKSSDLANNIKKPRKWMLVTQSFIGEETSKINNTAPRTWKYLKNNQERLDRRASVIYKNKPQFSIFGVGEYSFSPWKVAISGFYKKMDFRLIQPYNGKPVVFDDTCYFIACKSQEKAVLLELILNNEISKDFFSAFIFWDAKRPITKKLLEKLSIPAVISVIGEEFLLSAAKNSYPLLDFESLKTELNNLKLK